jgi:hypothetical protein
MAKRIRGLAKLIQALKATCIIIGTFGPVIRNFVPADKKSLYDSALASITAACSVIENIDYMDDDSGTEAPWGD